MYKIIIEISNINKYEKFIEYRKIEYASINIQFYSYYFVFHCFFKLLQISKFDLINTETRFTLFRNKFIELNTF